MFITALHIIVMFIAVLHKESHVY